MNREAPLWQKIKDRVNADHANWPSEGDRQPDVVQAASHLENVTEPQLDAVSSSLRPGKFATAFCSGRCASVSWFNPARGTADGRTFPPWRTSAAWQDVRVSYGVVSDHCKPPAGYLRLLSEAAGPRGGKARRPQRGKTRCGPRLVKKPGQNGQAMRALDGIGPVMPR